MDTRGADGSPIGGGEILKFWNQDYNTSSPWFNNELIKQYYLVPILKFVIIALLIGVMIYLILKVLGVKSVSKGRGITNELEYMNRVRQRDAQILRYNKLIAKITALVESSPFAMGNANKEYWEYNLTRADIKIPGGSRVIKPVEFHALIVFIAGCVLVVDIVIFLFVNFFIGAIMAILTIVMANSLPMIFVRGIVREKDDEIKHNFSDFYLMIHYVLISGSQTPLSNIMKSYAKTTDSKEMKNMVDVCVHYIETYGDFEATRYISKNYREIPVMTKLMRLIRQSREAGADVTEELKGFRQEILSEKKYEIEKRTNKLIARANASFNILMPVLLQAILSAMSIYLSDMGAISSFI